MKVVEPKNLFEATGLKLNGPTAWGTPVPEDGPGVYVITLSDPGDTSVTHLSEDELKRWNDGQEIVYIGRATSLRKRLQQFYNHNYGDNSPHRGGQAILLLDCKLQIFWASTSDVAVTEDRMIELFRESVGAMPFGNRVRSAQDKTKAA